MKKVSLFLLIVLGWLNFVNAQNAQFAAIDKRDNLQMNFEIIGKLNSNILIYKEVKNQKRIAVYDNNMKLLNDKTLDFIPAKASLIDLAFFQNGNTANMIYQFQAGNTMYCLASIIDAEGNAIGSPIIIDTTQIDYTSKGKIYNYITNDNGSKIGVFKINKKDKKNQVFDITVLNNSLNRQGSSEFTIKLPNNGDYITNYVLSNDGTFSFIKYNREKSGTITSAELIQNKLGTVNVYATDLNLDNVFLDDIKFKIDEKNNRYLITSLYADKKKGKIAGIYTAGIDKSNSKNLFTHIAPVNVQAKASKNASTKALDDHFINNFNINTDGTFSVISEVAASSYNYNYMGWGMYDYAGFGYWGSPWGFWGPGWYMMPNYMWGFTPWSGYWGGWGYYSPFFYRSYWWGSYWPNDRRNITYTNGNIAIFNFNKNGALVNQEMIFKKQSSTNTDAELSYQLVTHNKNLEFFINKSKKYDELVAISKNIDGTSNEKIAALATDKKMSFMPKYSKKIGNDLIVPYLHKKNISFVKINF